MRAKQGKKRKCAVNIKSFPALSAVVYATKVATTSVSCSVELSGLRGLGCSVCFLIPRRRRMAKGTVKWFNPTKGYGFIQPASGGKDVFVHISAVQKAGLSTLNEGQTIEYEEIANRGKTSAENIKV
jgi:CspA family cold shock protein